ncbi:MAG: hypothetical protein AAF208_11630 [Cyanobacteria bacterium P01_A01_bin.45]
MSEYQYYEFLALDKPLTAAQKADIEKISSRGEVTSNQAKFVYNYGDFRGDPQEVLGKYFDVMLYMANWGSRQLMFRFPKSLVNAKELESYCSQDGMTISTTSKSIIVDINIFDEDLNDWIDSGEGCLSGMVLLRDSIMRGDYRCLYLAWLKAATIYCDEEDLLEPPVPPNLNDLSGSLNAFIDFFAIDTDLISAAAMNSNLQEEEEESLGHMILNLNDQEKNDFLTRLLKGETNLNIELTYKLRELSGKQEVGLEANTNSRRKLSQLLEIAKEKAKKRIEKERELKHQAKIQRLEKLAKKKEEVWEQIFNDIARKQVKPYDKAVANLVELRDLAEHQGNLKEFQETVNQIAQDNSRLSGLISRLRKARLIPMNAKFK